MSGPEIARSGAPDTAWLPERPYTPSPAARAEQRALMALLRSPAPLRRAASGKPIVVDGEPLDPDLAVGLRLMNARGASDPPEESVPKAREEFIEQSWIFSGRPTQVGSVRNFTIPGAEGRLAARLFLPHLSAAEADDPLPMLVYFHGGGFVLGGLDGPDAICRQLCASAKVAILAITYRLAPENQFPAAVDDALAAWDWVVGHAPALGADPQRIGVGGNSAGANLAAVVAQQTVIAGKQSPCFQMLIVPPIDFGSSRPSKELFAEGFVLTQANLDWYQEQYLPPGTDVQDIRISPIYGPMTGLPPAYIAVAGFDPLRDEGIAYAEKLREAGVPVRLRVHGDAIHHMLSLLITKVGQRVVEEAAQAVAVGLNAGESTTAGAAK